MSTFSTSFVLHTTGFSPLQDIIVSGVFAFSLLAGGAANAAYSSDNNEFYNDNDRLRCENPPLSAFQDICDDVPVVRNSEAAAAVSYGELSMNLYSFTALRSCEKCFV